jgi:hypothetical protein
VTWVVCVILGIAIAGGAIWVLLRRAPREEPAAEAPHPDRPGSAPPSATQNKPPPARERSYFGASLDPGPDACDAAMALSGKRYLANEVPKLPLPECDAATCKCQIVPHSDRRAGHDRRDSFSAYGDHQPELDQTWRTRKRGRRKDD